MSRRSLVCVAVLTITSAAGAQDFGGDFFAPEGFSLLEGTTRYEAARQAGITNAQVYGAVGAFDRYVIPVLGAELEDGENLGLFAIEYGAIINAARAPGGCKTKITDATEGCLRGISMNNVDLYSSNFAFGYRGGLFGFFYTASYTLPVVVGEGLNRGSYGYITMMGPVIAHTLSPLRLFGKSTFNKVLPGDVDGVVGVSMNTKVGSAYAGYVYSQGVFGDIDVPELKSFVTTVLSQKFKELSYLKGGLRQFDYFSKSVPETIGRTSLYGRKLQLVPPQPAGVTDIADRQNLIDFVTVHFEQTDIAKYVDARVAYATTPVAQLHEARLSLHTENYAFNRGPYVEHGYQGDKKVPVEASLTAGMVSLPNLWYYGVEGGRRLSLTAELSVGPARVSIRRNDPEVLSTFPVAYDAWSFFAGIGIGFAGN
ncbi:MAG: hypothetical protein IPI67_28280 [Myxococcales bacterium]|nr:hypothetical protein [Myxococcales bacterium]